MPTGLPLRPGFIVPPLTTVTLVRNAFRVWGRNLVRFSLVALAVYTPFIAFWLSSRWIPALHDPLYGGGARAAGFVGFALVSLAGQLAAAAVTYGVVEQLAGRTASAGAMLAVTVRRGPGVLLVVAVTFAVTIAGMALFVVPGVILKVFLAVAVPAAVVERTGVLASMRRSSFLTNGHRWKVLVLLLAVEIFTSVVDKLVALVSNQLARTSPLGSFFLTQAAVAFALGLPAVAAAVAYHDLRFAKEGTRASDLARVFE